MSTEFIIGTIIGLIGIIPVVIQFAKWVRKRHNLRNLMNKLVDNSLSTKEHKKVLMLMNVKLLPIGKRISSEYIKPLKLNLLDAYIVDNLLHHLNIELIL